MLVRWIGSVVSAKLPWKHYRVPAACWSSGEASALGAGRLDGASAGWGVGSLLSLHWVTGCWQIGHPNWLVSAQALVLVTPWAALAAELPVANWVAKPSEMIPDCFLSLPCTDAAFHWALILWGSLRKTRLFSLCSKNLRGMCRRTGEEQVQQTKAELGSRSEEPSDGGQLGQGGDRPHSILSCACGQAAHLHLLHLLHLPQNAPGRSAWNHGGQGWAGPEGQGWGTSGFASSGLCGSAGMLQWCQGSGKLPDGRKHMRSLYPVTRKGRAKNS